MMPDIYCPLCGLELTEAEAELIAVQVLSSASIERFNRLIEIWKGRLEERPDDGPPPMKVEHPDTQALLRQRLLVARSILLVCDVYRRSVEDSVPTYTEVMAKSAPFRKEPKWCYPHERVPRSTTPSQRCIRRNAASWLIVRRLGALLFQRVYNRLMKLPTKTRNKLPASKFGMPGERKYPMPDRSHTANA